MEMAKRLTIRIPTCARLAVPRSAESAFHPPPAVDPHPPLPADLPVIRLVKMLWSSRWVTVPGSPSSGSFSTPPGRADARSSGMPVAEAIAAALSRSIIGLYARFSWCWQAGEEEEDRTSSIAKHYCIIPRAVSQFWSGLSSLEQPVSVAVFKSSTSRQAHSKLTD